MRLKTKIKWWYYKTFLCVFLISHFDLWPTFSLDELYEIKFSRKAIHDEFKRMYDEIGDKIICHKLEVHYRNEIHFYWYDKSNEKHLFVICCIAPQFIFGNHKWSEHLC